MKTYEDGLRDALAAVKFLRLGEHEKYTLMANYIEHYLHGTTSDREDAAYTLAVVQAELAIGELLEAA